MLVLLRHLWAGHCTNQLLFEFRFSFAAATIRPLSRPESSYPAFIAYLIVQFTAFFIHQVLVKQVDEKYSLFAAYASNQPIYIAIDLCSLLASDEPFYV